MNLLFISPAYHPVIGGAETHVRLLAEGMARLGHSVMVATDRRRPGSPHRERIEGVEVFRTSRYRRWRDEADRVPWEESLFGLLREFSQLFHERRIDVIHAHCQVSAVLGAMMVGSLGGKLVVTMHETQPELDPWGEGRSRLVYAHLPYDMLIACSQFFRDQALHYGAPPDRVRLIYYGVDLNRFNATISGDDVRARLGLRDDQPLVLLVGRFKARKGILEFIRAMARVSDVLPEARGLIAGSCHSASLDYVEAMRRDIDSLGLTQVVTIEDGTWNLDDMPQVYAAADLVVQPSYAEGLGISVLEALATQKPVIGTAVSGIQEIITPGQNGLLVPSRASAPLAEAIVNLLSDRAKAVRLAANGYAWVKEKFSTDRMIERTSSMYQQVMTRDG